MFTGIVEDTGIITSVRFGDDSLVGIKPTAIGTQCLKIGESIAVNGVCLTVVSVENEVFLVQISRETLSKTTMSEAGQGTAVNLERSVAPDGLMGGHIVTGHIDGVGTVESTAACGESVEFRFSLPGGFMRYVVPKGCIAINGVSLTVNAVADDWFSVNLIPHTLSKTTFRDFSAGREVNFECDIVAKYVERLIGFDRKKTL